MLFSFSFLIPIFVGFVYEESSINIFISLMIGIFLVGCCSWVFTRKDGSDLSLSDGFIITVLFWLILSLFGALPFYFLGFSFVDSLFESMSGITTTGATVFSGLDELDKSVLIYRQLLQWMGGMGLIVLAIAVMPLLGIGGGQLFKTQTPGAMSNQKLTPRITNTARALWLIYLGLTILCLSSYKLAGMSFFDSFAHALSTVSIGGFSTHDASIGFFKNINIEIVCMVFMILSAINFSLHYGLIYRKQFLKYFYDPELRFFLSILFVITTVVCISLITLTDIANPLRYGIFQSVSIVTTTGFLTEEYSSWPTMISFLLLLGAFMGACSGSVGGGIKSWRVLIIIKHGYIQIFKLIHPNSTNSIKIGRNPLQQNVTEALWAFFSIYVISFMVLLIAMLMTGLDFLTAFSAVGACLNNLGPGLGEVATNYSSLGVAAKSILSFAMILGRLEIFTLLVVLTPAFWQR